jgi:NAD(P)-dependent dehydrogenase (short-subunit alcohol dehydrogenase family)
MDGKRIAITGGFGFLGDALGRLALARGARVALIDRAAAPGRAPPSGALVVGGVDLTDPVATSAAFKTIEGSFGGLDGLANIAGGFIWGKVADGDLDMWDKLYAMNLKTAVTATTAALPLLIASPAGRIVNVGAAAALKAGAGMGAYTASKSGVMRFTEALAEELKSTSSVTVNAVLPSTIDTPANRAEMGDKNAHKWVSAEALSEVILFLLSDAARAVTGALLPVVGRV